MSSARFQELAIEKAAQRFSWNYSELTSSEVGRLIDHLNNTIAEPFGQPSNIQRAKDRARAALILKTMLYFGQSLERVRELRFVREGNPLKSVFTILFSKDGTSVLGWLLPAIGPRYRTDLSAELDDFNRELAPHFLLPDFTDLGKQVLAHPDTAGRPNDRIFGIEPKHAKSQAVAILGELKDARFTLAKVTRHLSSHIVARSHDQSLAWVICADGHSADEPRMHYTRHDTETVIQQYARAVNRMLIGAGQPISDMTSRPAAGSGSIGARFVLTMADFKTLVEQLCESVAPSRKQLSLTRIVNYHNAFTLYTWLLQSMLTTMRAIINPIQLISAFQSTPRHPFSGLFDKDNHYEPKTRLVRIPETLQMQYRYYQQHVRSLELQVGLRLGHLTEKQRLLFTIAPNGKPAKVTPTWIRDELAERLAPVPPNFHRAFLRTELTARRCPIEIIDAFLGHANRGESPFQRYSSFDFSAYASELKTLLEKILIETGLEARPSWLAS